MKKFWDFVTNTNGDVMPGYSVRVVDGSGFPVDIFADEAGTNFETENVTTTNNFGYVSFWWSPDEDQSLIVEKNGVAFTTIEDFATKYFGDPDIGDDLAAAQAAATAAAGSATDAEGFKNDAETAAGTATTKAGEASADADDAEDAKNAALAAQAAAETAALQVGSVKAPARVVARSNITLSGLQSIDGVTLVANDRVLVMTQNTRSQNGIYSAASGAWTRATDMDAASDFYGARIHVTDGFWGKGKLFQINQAVATLGTDDVVIEEIAQGGSVREQIGMTEGVLVTLGDSNYGGRIGFYNGLVREIRPATAPLGRWLHYNCAQSGYTTTGFLNSIADTVTYDADEAPADQNPNVGSNVFNGNGWQVINAFRQNEKSGIIILSLGINDLGLSDQRKSIALGGKDTVNRFSEYLDRMVYLLLGMVPDCAILLHTPAPFAGEDWFIGPDNFTNWATYPGASTIDEGAALASAAVRSAYRQWVGRHPRVSLWDSQADLFGTSADDKAVDAQDPEGQGALLDDSLHFTDLAGRRIVQHLARALGLPGRRRSDTVTPNFSNEVYDAYWRQAFVIETAATISGSDTRVALNNDTGELFAKVRRSRRRSGDLLVPLGELDMVRNAEYFGYCNPRGILTMKRDVKLYFPATGNTYVPTGVSLFTTSTTTDGLPRVIITFAGVNFATADRPAGTEVIVYTTSRLGIPYSQRQMQFSIEPTSTAGGGAHNPYPFDWYPTNYRFQRGVGTNAITVELWAQNIDDGRLVDGAINSVTAPGYRVASISLANGIYQGTMTPDTSNWPSGFLFKSSYRLVARVTSGTLVGLGTVTVRD